MTAKDARGCSGQAAEMLVSSGNGGKTWERDAGELLGQSKRLQHEAMETRLLGPRGGEVCPAPTHGHAAEQPSLVETR